MAIVERSAKGTTRQAANRKSDSVASGNAGTAQKAFLDASIAYWDSLISSWNDRAAGIRVQEAATAALTDTAPQPTDFASMQEAQASYARRLQDAWMPPETYDAIDEAFTEYVGKLKEAWADLDAGDVLPEDLTAIAQLINTASCLVTIPLPRRRRAS